MPSSQASNLKMKTAGFYETLVSINESMGSHLPQDTQELLTSHKNQLL
jgi:hypothetical protein